MMVPEKLSVEWEVPAENFCSEGFVSWVLLSLDFPSFFQNLA